MNDEVQPAKGRELADPGWRGDELRYETDPGHLRSRWALSVPNETLRNASSIGDLGWFYAIGEAWSQVALALMPVADPLVIDVGCGCGKMGRFLMLHPTLRYVGLDVFKPAVLSCHAEFTKVYGDRSRFLHLDVQSDLYNFSGRFSATEIVFPLDDGVGDFVLCGSLFTHLLEDEMLHYLEEIRRILKPGGRMLASIHVDPVPGKRFSGDAARIDMDPEFFIESCQDANLRLTEAIGNIYGQQVFLMTRESH